jgi:hypothetical protein
LSTAIKVINLSEAGLWTVACLKHSVKKRKQNMKHFSTTQKFAHFQGAKPWSASSN